MPRTVSREEVVETLCRLAADQVGVNAGEVSEKTHLYRDLNFDSLNTVDFVMGIEDGFDVSVPDEAAEKVKTVADGADLLVSLLADRGRGSGAEVRAL